MADKPKPSENPWGPKPIRDMTQKEFEQKHRDNQSKPKGDS